MKNRLSLFLASGVTAGKNRTATGKIIRIASAGVAISIMVMILAIGIVKGFQNEIKSKATGFSGHLSIKKLELNQSGEWSLFTEKQVDLRSIRSLPGVSGVFPVCMKPGILKTGAEAEGIQCKGVAEGYEAVFLKKQLVRGRFPGHSSEEQVHEVLISEVTAQRMKLDTGMRVELYFIQDGKVRRRKPLICGIYSTGIYEIDKTWILTDIRMVQRVYTQGYDSISGYEVFLNSLERLGAYREQINERTGTELTVLSVEDTHFQIFQWLRLLDMNVMIIIILMIAVSVVNMMTALLVLIIDRTPMIGLLKALGARNRLIVQSFLMSGARYLLYGLISGNLAGLGLGLLQRYTGLIRLNQQTYYLTEVPFEISAPDLLLINGLTFGVCLALLLVPALYVARIEPVKAIRFD